MDRAIEESGLEGADRDKAKNLLINLVKLVAKASTPQAASTKDLSAVQQALNDTLAKIEDAKKSLAEEAAAIKADRTRLNEQMAAVAEKIEKFESLPTGGSNGSDLPETPRDLKSGWEDGNILTAIVNRR